MEKISITSYINTALIRGEKAIEIKGGEYNVNKAFISVNTADVSFFGGGCVIRGESNILELKDASNVKFSGFVFSSTADKDFAVRISKSENLSFEGCTFSSRTGCIIISDANNVTFKDCEFDGEEGNGICILNESVVNIQNCNFTLANGEGVTVAENKDGIVTVHNSSFKRCLRAIKSVGRNALKITNNYFLSYAQALEIAPSPISPQTDGIYKAEIKYNLFDECCKEDGEATVVIRGSDSGYAHKEIVITENIFSQKERAVINAKGVSYLLFKENNVRTNGESTVENSIINGIRA